MFSFMYLPQPTIILQRGIWVYRQVGLLWPFTGRKKVASNPNQQVPALLCVLWNLQQRPWTIWSLHSLLTSPAEICSWSVQLAQFGSGGHLLLIEPNLSLYCKTLSQSFNLANINLSHHTAWGKWMPDGLGERKDHIHQKERKKITLFLLCYEAFLCIHSSGYIVSNYTAILTICSIQPSPTYTSISKP